MTVRDLWQRLIAPIDPPLMTMAALLLAFALLVVSSASIERLGAQLLNMLVALVVMRLAAQVPPQRLMYFALPIFVGGLLLLVAVAMFGDVSKGARRWLNLGFMRIQPSEIMKIAMPLMLAWYFQRHETFLRLREYVVAAILLLAPVALIARQPDLGTAILVLAAGFYVIFLAGLPWKLLAGLLIAAVAAAPLAWSVMHDYQRNRILTLLDPEADPLGKGFHIIQSTIAIGSGGILGKGWGQGTQAQLEFIPERHTDFIFAVLSEEFGLLGNTLLLILYASLIARGMMIAANAARHDDRRQCPDPVHATPGRQHHPDLLYLCLRQHGHGQRPAAGGRRAVAIRQLWRDIADDVIRRHRNSDEHPQAPDAGAKMIRLAPALLLSVLAACGGQPPRQAQERGGTPAPVPQASPAPAQGPAPASKPAYVLKRNGGFYQDDGPGENPPTPAFLSAIPDAEPRIEPLHRFANKPYSVLGRDYAPLTRLTHYKALGLGSWYGRKFHGQKTSSGETYDMFGMTAAHATLPIPSYVRVTNPANRKSVVVRVNDRGPFHSGRLIDLSYSAAWKLGYVDSGSTLLEVESVLPGNTLLAAGPALTGSREATTPADPLAALLQFGSATSTAAEKQLASSLPQERDSRGVFLQLGAFGNSDNAENLKSRLGRELAGLPGTAELSEKLLVQARNGVYRVQLGPWRDREEARQIAERLQTAYNLTSVLVR